MHGRLLESAALKSLTDDRIAPAMLADADRLPGIVYARMGTQRARALGGPVGNAAPRFEVRCMAAADRQGYREALRLAREARLILDGFKGAWQGHYIEDVAVEDERDDPAEVLFGSGALGVVHQRILAVSIDHAEETRNNEQP